jgi:hypothetical protein
MTFYMKTNSSINGILIPVKRSIRRFHAPRGIALLRALRLRLAEPDRANPVQTEFNFQTLARNYDFLISRTRT